MALPPKEVIRPKTKIITNFISKPKNLLSIFGVVFLLFTESISYLFWDNKNYSTYWYYILNNLGFAILLANYLVNYERLRFCNLKIFGIMILILYYLLGIFAILFNLVSFIDNIKFFFLISSSILLAFSFFGKK